MPLPYCNIPMSLEFTLEESTEAPQHFKDIEIKPDDDLHKQIAKTLFFDDYINSKDPPATFAEWYQQNKYLEDKFKLEKPVIEKKSFILKFNKKELYSNDVVDSISDLVLKAQKQAKETKSPVLYELKITDWEDSYGIILANGTESKPEMQEKDVPVWINIGANSKWYNFVGVKKDDKTDLFYIHPIETIDVKIVKYDN